MPATMPFITHLLHSSRFHVPLRLLLACMMVLTCWFAFTPQPPNFQFKNADKVNHLLAFGSLTLVAGLSWMSGRTQALAVVVGMGLFGVFIELVQSQLPTRSAEWADLAADSLGIAGGLVLLLMLRRWRPTST
jgi:VanZ family protein